MTCRPAPAVAALAALMLLALPAAAQEAKEECLAGLAATPLASGGVALAWPPANVTGLTGYQVLVRPDGGAWLAVQTPIDAATTSFEHRGAQEGVPHDYVVVAMAGDQTLDAYCTASAVARTTYAITLVSEGPTAEVPIFPSAWALGAGVAGLALATVFMVRRGRKGA